VFADSIRDFHEIAKFALPAFHFVEIEHRDMSIFDFAVETFDDGTAKRLSS
jgi:hypothetical protein